MATLSSIITPTNITTASNTQTLTNKTITGGILNGTLGATTPSTVAATTLSTTGNAAIGGSINSGVGLFVQSSVTGSTSAALSVNGTTTYTANGVGSYGSLFQGNIATGGYTGLTYVNAGVNTPVLSGGGSVSAYQLVIYAAPASAAAKYGLYQIGSDANYLGGSLQVAGALSKGSGSFRIEHPLPSKSATHQLVHSFIEGPKCDLIYRGKINLVDGKASVNIDTDSTMTEGTFEALCANVQCFTSNESGWGAIRGKVTGNILTIEAQDAASTDNVSWMVIGERKDKHIMDTDWTDKNGRPIVEPLKPAEPALESK